jgi:hypothetical protein
VEWYFADFLLRKYQRKHGGLALHKLKGGFDYLLLPKPPAHRRPTCLALVEASFVDGIVTSESAYA